MKRMKKLLILATIPLFMSSCATVFGGKITDYQKTKPAEGSRDIRVGALVADILLFWPGTIIDFATGAIYQPE